MDGVTRSITPEEILWLGVGCHDFKSLLKKLQFLFSRLCFQKVHVDQNYCVCIFKTPSFQNTELSSLGSVAVILGKCGELQYME